MKIKVVSVNISEEKGTIKNPVDCIEINQQGVSGDAHAGWWNRQISLLASESIEKFSKESNRVFKPGEFAENITTSGLALYDTRPLDRFVIGETEVEVTQIGKGCHGDGCAIYREVGNCVMPKEGIFCRTIKSGKIRPGDVIQYLPRIMRVYVLTLSDRASRGEYEDRSGPKTAALVKDFFLQNGYESIVEQDIIADDPVALRQKLVEANNQKFDAIFTTGGTGIGPRDITPDVTKTLLDREIPGIMEQIRLKYGQEKPNALLSRAVAGVMGSSLVFNMPGSVRAVREYTTEIFKSIKHMIYMLHGLDLH
ncbi:MAG TPA: MOSC domain-containing protein [Bacteroidales bacterium]|nr:MOSC domain-containing protein [Bacteroidales bacterium]